MTIDINAIKATAQAEYAKEVATALNDKFKTIAKRTAQLKAFENALNKQVAEFKAACENRVSDLETALAAATNEAEMMVAIKASSFHTREYQLNTIQFHPVQGE